MTSLASLELTKRQLEYATGIIAAVKQRGLPARLAVIAIETALAESGLRMYANGHNAESLALPHDAVGWDHGSVGLFQQQVGGAPMSTASWGTTRELMDPTTSAAKFLAAVEKTDWHRSTNWQASQNVQRSAFDGMARDANNHNGEYGGNYRAHDAHASAIVDALWGGVTPDRRVKYWVDLFDNAPVFGSPTSQVETGTLFKGTSYVFGKRRGRIIFTPLGHNHWWLKTDPDEGTGRWVSAYYLSRWGNDEAQDNAGGVIPDC